MLINKPGHGTAIIVLFSPQAVAVVTARLISLSHTSNPPWFSIQSLLFHRMGSQISQSPQIKASIPSDSEESRVNEQESTRIASQAEQVAPSLSNEKAGSAQSLCV